MRLFNVRHLFGLSVVALLAAASFNLERFIPAPVPVVSEPAAIVDSPAPSPLDKKLEGLSPEERHIVKSALPTVEVKLNPLVDKLLCVSSPAARPSSAVPRRAPVDFSKLRGFYENNRTFITLTAWVVPTALLLVALIVFLLGYNGLSGSLAEGSSFIARGWLVVLFLATIAVHLIARQSPWPFLHPDLWRYPLLDLIVSVFLIAAIESDVKGATLGIPRGAFSRFRQSLRTSLDQFIDRCMGS